MSHSCCWIWVCLGLMGWGHHRRAGRYDGIMAVVTLWGWESACKGDLARLGQMVHESSSL